MNRSAGSDGVVGALADLIGSSARVGRELLRSFTSDPVGRVLDVTSRSATKLTATGFRASGCGCEIPPPCWMPEQLGNLTSHVCPGATASVRLRITNCGMSSRDVTVTVGGPDSLLVTIDPPAIALLAFESGTATATVTAPDKIGQQFHAQLWVHGCRDHLLRWTVDVSRHGCGCAHEIEIDDCPDLIHHWYDHFYCDRPCPGGAERSHA